MDHNTKFNMLFEDLTMVANQYTAGQTRAHKPTKVSILDIVKSWRDSHTTDPENLTNSKPALYPLNDAFVERLADHFLKCNDFQTELKSLYNNPAINENDTYKKSVNNLYKKFSKIKKILLSMGDDLDNLAFDE